MNHLSNAMKSPTTNWTLMKPVILIAAIIGCVQGLTWSILSLIPIIIYNGNITVNKENLGDYTRILYINLLSEESIIPDNYVMKNYVFNVIMYFYLILSFSWFASSCILFYATTKSYNNVKIGTIWWTIIAFLSSLMDLITMSMLASDYTKADEDIRNGILRIGRTMFLTLYGIMITAAARGFVLWIVNVAFATVLGLFAKDMHGQNLGPRRSLINAYGASPRAFSLYEETEVGPGKANESFQDDEPTFPRYHPEERSNLSNYPNYQKNDLNGYKFQTAPENRFAHIGKPGGGRRSPPDQRYPRAAPYNPGNHSYGNIAPSPIANNLPPVQPVPHQHTNPNMPHIPRPDYSPPISPSAQRSALKPRSRYE